MREQKAIELITQNLSCINDRCHQMIKRGEIEAAVRASADARYHAWQFSAWYLPNPNSKRRRRVS
jgi:hypothetical protein